MMRTAVQSHEFLIAVALVALCIVIGVVNPVFFSLSNLFDLLKSASVMGIFAIGFLLELVFRAELTSRSPRLRP